MLFICLSNILETTVKGRGGELTILCRHHELTRCEAFFSSSLQVWKPRNENTYAFLFMRIFEASTTKCDEPRMIRSQYYRNSAFICTKTFECDFHPWACPKRFFQSIWYLYRPDFISECGMALRRKKNVKRKWFSLIESHIELWAHCKLILRSKWF